MKFKLYSLLYLQLRLTFELSVWAVNIYIFIVFYRIFIGMNSQVNHFFFPVLFALMLRNFVASMQGILHHLQIGFIF